MQKYAGQGPRLMPEGADEALRAKQVQVLADGGCDAMVRTLCPISVFFFSFFHEMMMMMMVVVVLRQVENPIDEMFN